MNSAVASRGPEAGRRRSPLPADVSAFIGRVDELATLAAMLPSARLVTVTGPGGVGKTRLALRAAAGALGDYPDGICFIELSGLADERQLGAAVARCLRLRGSDPRSGSAAVLDYLRGKRLLLVFDTCEHLTAACARLAAQVRREASGVTILATSRQPLHVDGERVLRLGPLPLPGSGGERAPGDAVELFAVRAAAALPGFTVTAATLPDVIRLCRRLDGIPLAIELAAVRVRALPLTELTRRLDARFSLLTGARRGMVPRHQTLQAAIDWSYNLCTDDEQAVWGRLSVFSGSFDLAVAEHVATCAQVPDHQVSGVLASLVDKSVVLPADGRGQYRLLDAVREYAAERLAGDGQEADCRRRHASWYLDMARDFGHHQLDDDQRARLARLRREHANIRAALARGFAGGGTAPGAERGADLEPGADLERTAGRLASALLPYWLMSGALREGIHWQDKALEQLGAPSAERASALASRAVLGAVLGRPAAVAYAREAVTLAARAGDERSVACGYLSLQLALGLTGACPQAREAAARARRLLTALGADTALRCLDASLALTLALGGEFAAAADLIQRTLAGLRPGERWLRGCAHVVSALALYQQPGRQAECARAAGEALRASREFDGLIGEAYALEIFGWLAADAAAAGRAAWLLGAAQGLWERAGGRLSGNAVLESCHRRAAQAASDALGDGEYAQLHARGAASPLGQIVALAIGGADTLPDVPSPRAAGDSAAGATTGGADPGEAGPGEPGPAGASVDGLTGRERQIAVLVATGLSNREIAARLVISQRTVDAHVNHIFTKLGVSSRVQLTRRLSDRAAPS